jgi:mannose-1-phosphate guanylyltransferase
MGTKINKKIAAMAALAIIAGGQGTRLFPISNENCPKQFCPLNAETTFIQDSIIRFVKAGMDPKRIIIVVTNQNQYDLALRQTAGLGVIEPNILLISPKHDYAGAMIKADEYIERVFGDTIVVHTPADQFVNRGPNFTDAVIAMLESADSTPTILGVEKHDINTMMGCGHAKYEPGKGNIRKVTGFIEKPDRLKAEELMREGGSRVNTGICAWRTSHVPKKFRGYDEPLKTDVLMDEFLNSESLNLVLGKFDWFDCGTLDSFWQISAKTPNHQNASFEAADGGSIHRGNDSRRSLFFTIPGVELFGSHVKDAAVVINRIGDKIAICVVARSASQLVRSLAEDFEKNKDILERHFTLDGVNNRVSRTDCSDEIYCGFVGVSDYSVTVIKLPNSHYVVSVSKDSVAA